MALGTRKSCTCDACQNACEHKPGWLKPGEAELIAEHFGLGLDELFAAYLAVDSHDESGGAVQILSPGIVGLPTGEEFLYGESNGVCVFYEDGLCTIHAVKPYECRLALHGEPNDEARSEVVDAWREQQWQIQQLLDM